jgi:hypothetical protein
MNSAYFPRISDSPLDDELKRLRGRPKGSISVIVTLMFLAFAILGMSMVLLVQVHLRVGAGRKNSVILDYASENGIKQALTDVSSRLEDGKTLAEISKAQEAAYRSDARSGGCGIAEDFFGWKFPRLVRETWKETNWESTTACSPEIIEDREEFTSVAYGFRIDSVGSLAMFRPERASNCKASLGAIVGRLPLPSIPLLIDKSMNPGDESGFMKKNGISFASGPKGEMSPRLQSADSTVISDFPESLLSKTLKVHIFKPEDLKPAVIRRAIGLEPINEPVPEGVYLIRDDLGLGGVFAQGDIDEMVTAIENDWQIICFRSGDEEWVLRFSPTRGMTSFETPSTVQSFNLVPAGILCVNGKILSLGGGIVDSDGRIRMVTDEARPSILSGISLTIISSEGVTISSHLISQGVLWKDGIPYAADGNSQLVIYSTGKDLVNGEAREGKISVAEGSPGDLAIQASLIARGEGVVVEGRGKEINVLGGIQASDISSEGNTVRITPDGATGRGRPFRGDSPLTAHPMLYISYFRVSEWREY